MHSITEDSSFNNLIHLSKVFNIQALIHLNKEQLQVVLWSVWLTAVKIPLFFSGESLNFNQLDMQKLDVVSCFFFYWRQVVNFPKIHWNTIPYTCHDLCRVFGIQTAGLMLGICLSNQLSAKHTHTHTHICITIKMFNM